MKKLITTAAMLAASTAFTHAASVFFTFNEVSLLDGITKNISANSTDISSVEEDLSAINDGAQFSLTCSVKNDFLMKSSVKASTLDASVISGLSSATGLSETTISAIKVGVLSSGSFHMAELTVTLTGLQTGEQYLVSTIGKIAKLSSDYGAFSLAAGNFISGNYGGKTTTWREMTSATISVSNDPFATAMVVTPNDEGTVSFTISNGSSSNGQMHLAFFGISTVPEPSAFGLLAGLGAIALAVSRRKRRSR